MLGQAGVWFRKEMLFIVTGQITIVTELSPHGDLLRYLWKVGSDGLKMPHDRSATILTFLMCCMQNRIFLQCSTTTS